MKNDRDKEEFDLELVHLERLGDIIFYIGTILAIISTYEEEQSIIHPQAQPSPIKEASTPINNYTKTIALASWIFLAAVIIFSITSYLRFEEQKSNTQEDAPLSNKRNLMGGEIVTIGNFIKVIGFALTAVGNQIRADNPLEKTNS